MKTTKLALVILIFCIAINGIATEIPKMTVVPAENKKAIIHFESTNPTALELIIRNDLGEIIHSEKINTQTNSYNKEFTFDENKNYCVSINYGNKSINRDLQFSKNAGLKVGKSEHFFEPYINFHENKLYVSFLNIAEKNVYLKIYKDDQLITGKNLGKEMCIQSCFDLTFTEKGSYKIVLDEYLTEHSFMVQK